MAFAEVRRLLVQQLVWVGVVTGMALGAAWAVGNRVILRRMQALVQATQRLAAGDLRARTGLPHGPGEFSHLAQAFDAMAAAIREFRPDVDVVAIIRGSEDLESETKRLEPQLVICSPPVPENPVATRLALIEISPDSTQPTNFRV